MKKLNISVRQWDTYNIIDRVDYHDNFFWVDRYNAPGMFTITIKNKELDPLIWKEDNYVTCTLSDKTMIIESIQSSSDSTSGVTHTISGRSLECIAERRIIVDQLQIDSNIYDGIKLLWEKCFKDDRRTLRVIQNFDFAPIPESKFITYIMKEQFTGDNFMDIVNEYTQAYGSGWYIKYNQTNKRYIMGLYVGTTKEYLVFGEKWDTLLSTQMMSDITDYKTIGYGYGVGEAEERIMVTYSVEEDVPSIKVRELYVDARDLDIYGPDDQPMTIDAYKNMLFSRTKEKVLLQPKLFSIDGIASRDVSYEYMTDYYLGDIIKVQTYFKDKFVHSMITEVAISEDGSGIQVVPTFTPIGGIE